MSAQKKPYQQLAPRGGPGEGPANAEVEEEVQQSAIVEFFAVLYEEGM